MADPEHDSNIIHVWQQHSSCASCSADAPFYVYGPAWLSESIHSPLAGIGFCVADFQPDRLPGWEPHSYGYHGDDGHACQGSGKGCAFGPTYTTGIQESHLGVEATLFCGTPVN